MYSGDHRGRLPSVTKEITLCTEKKTQILLEHNCFAGGESILPFFYSYQLCGLCE